MCPFWVAATWINRVHVLFYTALQFNDIPLLASSLGAGVRGHPGVKEHTDHKPRNALPGGLADELARTQNNKTQRIHMFLCETQQTGSQISKRHKIK